MQLRNITVRTLPVKRSRGQSAVAGAAYRAGEKLTDTRLGKTTDYSARLPDVWHKEILAPEGAPDWALNRAILWNEAEAAERRKDGRPARDVTLGLPWTMSREEHEEAARSFVQRAFVDKGHVVDLCFHTYGKRVTDTSEEGRITLRRWAARDVPFLERSECEHLHEPHVKIERDGSGDVVGYKIFQPHAHAYVTPRSITCEGFALKRNREFDRAEQTMNWRFDWPKHLNQRLEAEGYDFRVSATALEGDEDIPLKPEDVPLQSYHIELEGKESLLREERDFNRVHNEAVRDAAHTRQAEAEQRIEPQAARFARVKAWFQSLRASFSEWREHIEEHASRWLQHGEDVAEPDPTAPDPATEEQDRHEQQDLRDDPDHTPER